MGVTAWDSRDASEQVILYALNNTPSIVIDCANKADPHKYLPLTDADSFDHVHVISIDLLYSLRDVIYSLPRHAQNLSTKTICFTSFSRLFNYQDDEENAQVYAHSWQLLKKLASTYDIHVAVTDKRQRAFSKIYSDKIMGHTASSQRQVVDRLTTELKRYADVLSPQERERFEEMMKKPLQRIAPITHASSLHTWAFMLVSICLAQQEEIERLKSG